MSNGVLQVTITETSRIKKYAEGADPEKDEPFEVIESKPVVLRGKQAEQLLHKLGLKPDEFRKHTSRERRVIHSGDDQRI